MNVDSSSNVACLSEVHVYAPCSPVDGFGDIGVREYDVLLGISKELSDWGNNAYRALAIELKSDFL